MKKLFLFLTTLIVALSLAAGCTSSVTQTSVPESENVQTDEHDISESALKKAEEIVKEDGVYTTPALVAAYLHTFNKLPSNYITKKEAQKLGWDSQKGNLAEAAPGKSIGGDRFGNYENRLPKGNYRECDVNYKEGRRGSERIIYSDSGDIYYTGDHYNTFDELY